MEIDSATIATGPNHLEMPCLKKIQNFKLCPRCEFFSPQAVRKCASPKFFWICSPPFAQRSYQKKFGPKTNAQDTWPLRNSAPNNFLTIKQKEIELPQMRKACGVYLMVFPQMRKACNQNFQDACDAESLGVFSKREKRIFIHQNEVVNPSSPVFMSRILK